VIRFLHALTCATAFISGVAAADQPFYDPPIDFQLRLSNHELTLDYANGAKVDTRVKRAGFYWRERYSERVQLGLIGGYSTLTQTEHAATAGAEPEGNHAGLSLDIDLYRSTNVLVTLGVMYLHQNVRHKDAGQTVKLSWDEPSARVGATLRLSSGLWAYGAVRYGKIDGEERLQGTVNQTLAIERKAQGGGALGLEMELPDNGYVGVVVESGLDDTVGVYFGRRY
jgi:hypothetical protein